MMKKLLYIILLFISYVSYGQYNPTLHTMTNKAIGYGQATPPDARSMYYDATNAIYRDYQSTNECLGYLNLSKYRVGGFDIMLHSGGTLNSNGTYTGGVTLVYWFKGCTADTCLVQKINNGIGDTTALMRKANNLSDVTNAASARTNLGLGGMATQSINAGGDLSGVWPTTTVAKFNGQPPTYYLNYNNLLNTPTIPQQLNPSAAGLMLITGTYPNLTFNAQTPTLQQAITQGNTLSKTDTINAGGFPLYIQGTAAFGLPTGTTVQRPSAPSAGYTRFNTDSVSIEVWNGSAWIKSGAGGAGGSGITALQGDVSGSGTGTVNTTLATVNTNTYASNTFLKFGVNGKGLVTSATPVLSSDITAALGTVGPNNSVIFNKGSTFVGHSFFTYDSLYANLNIGTNTISNTAALSYSKTATIVNGYGNNVGGHFSITSGDSNTTAYSGSGAYGFTFGKKNQNAGGLYVTMIGHDNYNYGSNNWIIGNYDSTSGGSNLIVGDSSKSYAGSTIGKGLVSNAFGSLVVGQYNDTTGLAALASSARPSFIVAVGTGMTSRKNAFRVWPSGTIELSQLKNNATLDSVLQVDASGNVKQIVKSAVGLQSITLTGDVTGSGSSTIPTTLANSGVTASTTTLTNISVDSKGRITNASQGILHWGVNPVNINTNGNGQIGYCAEADYVYIKGNGVPDTLKHFYNKTTARDTLWVRYSLDGGTTWSTPVKANLHLWFPQIEFYSGTNLYYATGTTSAEKNVWLYSSPDGLTWTALNSGNPVLSASTDTTNYAYSLFNTAIAIIRTNGVDTIHYLCEGSAKQAQAGVTAGGGWYANGPYSGYVKAPLSAPAATLPLKPQLTGGNAKLFFIPEHNAFMCMYGIYTGQFPDYSQPWYIQFAKASLANNLQDSTSWIPIKRLWTNLGNSADPSIAFLGNNDSAIVYYEYNQGASGNQAYMPHMRSPLQLFRSLTDSVSSVFQNLRIKGYAYLGNTSLTEYLSGDNTNNAYLGAASGIYHYIGGVAKSYQNQYGLTLGNGTAAPNGATLYIPLGSAVIGSGINSLGGDIQVTDPTTNTSTSQNLISLLAANASYPTLNLGTSPTRYGSLTWSDPSGAGLFLQTYANSFPVTIQGSYTAFSPGGTEKARVTSGGLFLIGATTPIGAEKARVFGKLAIDTLAAGTSGVDSQVVWNSTTHDLRKVAPYATPTLQQTITAGNALTKNDTINASTYYLYLQGTSALGLPSGTTAQRPTAITGMMRFNTDSAEIERYNGTAWSKLSGSGGGTPTYFINSKLGDTTFRTTGPGLAANTIQWKGLIPGNGMNSVTTDSTIKYNWGGTLAQATTINNNGFTTTFSGTGNTIVSGGGQLLAGTTTPIALERVRVFGKLAVDTLASGTSGVDSQVVWNVTNKDFRKVAPYSTPTLQQTISAGNALTQNNSVLLGTYTLKFTTSGPGWFTPIATPSGRHNYTFNLNVPDSSLGISWQQPAGFTKGSAIVIDTNNNVFSGAIYPAGGVTGLPQWSTGNNVGIAYLQVTQAMFSHIRTVSATTTLTIGSTNGDRTILVDATAGSIVITLPAASASYGSNTGLELVFRRIDASANTVTVQRAGTDTIDGATNFTMSSAQVKRIQAASTSAWYSL